MGSLTFVPVALLDRVSDHRVLLVAAGDLGDVSCLQGQRDELLEAIAVSLLERGALRLPVVGKNDDVVRSRCVAPRPVDARELLVELPKRFERVRTLEPRVVRDLVVAREGRVHRRHAPSSGQ